MNFKTILGISAVLTVFVVAGVSSQTLAAKEKEKAAKSEQTSGTEKNAGAKKANEKKAEAPAKDPAKDKVALVNGIAIPRSELDNEMGRYERQMAMTGQTPDAAQKDEVKKKILDGLISRELLKQEAQKQNVKLEPAEVDEQVAALKKRFPSEAEFAAALGKMNLTEESLKAQYAQDLAIKRLIEQQVASRVTVTEQEIKEFYDSKPEYFKSPEMVRASHILIKIEPNATEEDKNKAKEKIVVIRERIVKGEDFAVVAKETSDCPSKERGGDLDFFPRGQMVPPFENAAFSQQVGELGEVIETKFGYHIIKVTEKRVEGTVPFEEVKGKIEQFLKGEKVNKDLGEYVAQLRSKAAIETFL